MPRRPALAPSKPFKIYLSQANSAQLELMTYQPGVGRNRFGEVSRIANEAFELYFKTLKEQACTDQKPKPDSAS